jgi:hypothetical protein
MTRKVVSPYRSLGQRQRRERERKAAREYAQRPENAPQRYLVFALVVIFGAAIVLSLMFRFMGVLKP